MESFTDVIGREHWLVLRAQAGDVAAWDGLLSATQPWLHAYLKRLLGESNIADDVLQAVFLLIFRKLRFLAEPRVYRSWVYRIATREAMRFIKKERRRSGRHTEVDDLAALPAASTTQPPDPQLSEAMREKIERLGPNTQAVIVLHYLEGMSILHVADVLDLSVGTAKSRLAYGLMLLRQRAAAEDRP